MQNSNRHCHQRVLIHPHQRRPLPDEDDASVAYRPVCASVRAATIGGTTIDDYSGHQATELDSHTNMAVAGCDCTIIARSGCFANVTPFHKDLPAMEMVEIGDAMFA